MLQPTHVLIKSPWPQGLPVGTELFLLDSVTHLYRRADGKDFVPPEGLALDPFPVSVFFPHEVQRLQHSPALSNPLISSNDSHYFANDY